MTEKWIVDDAGTLINMSTRNHYDYMEEVVDVLNKLSEENERLKDFIKKLADDNGNIILINGYGYHISKVINDGK